MLAKPEPTRYVVLGAILVAVMIVRPNGLLGERRVEIVWCGRGLMATRCSSSRRCRWRSADSRSSSSLDLHVDEGEIVSVIGPNGAGKTTLFNLVTGVYEPTEGDIRFAGESITGLDPHKITRRGIARTFQSLRLFLNMTVRENVMAAAYGHTRAGAFRSMLRTPGTAPRGARDPRARREAACVLRRAPDGLPLGPARVLAFLREPAPAGDRPRDRDESQAPPPRRARRRDEPARDAGDHRADRPAALGGRVHDPRDRARHARRGGHLRPRRRARPRREDRRGHVRARSRPTHASSRRISAPAGWPGSERDAEPAAARSSSRASTPTTARSTSSRTRTCRSGEGELVCLLGGNASGKSTTLKTILGIVHPRTGAVGLAGEDVTGADRAPDRARARDRARRTGGCSAR